MKQLFRVLSIMTAFGLFGVVSVAQKASDSGIRLDPTQIAAVAASGGGAGTSGVAGIRTRVLKGDPTKPGLYTIQLTVPANTTVQAHLHPDDRVATVISGIWNIGYGNRFDPRKLKALPPGSFYTEPPNVNHFARTGKTAVVVQITGYGPTGTQYVEISEKP